MDGLTGEELAGVTLGGGGRWILLEPDRGPLDDRLDAAVATLADHGYRALLAHPERHVAHDMVQRLRRLTERGALIQVTAAFFRHPRARSGMRDLATAGVVHVLASDAHSSRSGRPLRVSDAFEELRAIPGIGDHLDWVAQTAPAAIAAGQELTPPF